MSLFRATALALAITGLAAPALAKDLVLEDYFKGHTIAYGKFSAINGVKRSFRVDLTGRQRGKAFTLREDFAYDDGVKETKTWTFVRTGPKTYKGTRDDVIGDTTVHLSGNTARFNYLVNLNPGGKKQVVRSYDKLTLKDDGTLLNGSIITKFILPVAKVQVNFAKTEKAALAVKP